MQDLWIALIHCVPTEESISIKGGIEMSGAYTNGLVMASSESEALRLFANQLGSEGFSVLTVDDLETYESRLKHANPETDIRKLAARARRSRQAEFGDFYYYNSDENEQ